MLNNKKVLVLCDDYWHPGQTVIDGIVPLKKEGFTLDIIVDAMDFKPEMLQNYPVVLLSKCDEISAQNKKSWKTPEVQKAFIEYVEDGGGLLVIHTGTVAGAQTVELDKLIGCRFTYHPAQTTVLVQPLKPHPITQGVESFWEMDEHYHLELLQEDMDILFASYSPPLGEESKYDEDEYHNYPAYLSLSGYVRSQGKGRVCVLTPGHNPAVWLQENFRRTLKNALHWLTAKN